MVHIIKVITTYSKSPYRRGQLISSLRAIYICPHITYHSQQKKKKTCHFESENLANDSVREQGLNPSDYYDNAFNHSYMGHIKICDISRSWPHSFK
jgi:hypothetical protein